MGAKKKVHVKHIKYVLYMVNKHYKPQTKTNSTIQY